VSARHAGVNVPLFSLRSEHGWGIGELPDLATMTGWMAEARFDRLMLLPLGTMPHGQTSPYSAVSTLAIDPIYISLRRLPDFERAGGMAALSGGAREAIDAARRASIVWYDMVRVAKEEALRRAFSWFVDDEWSARTPRAEALSAYVERERWWIDDYALFLALRDAHGRASWRDWPPALAARHPEAMADARQMFGREVLFHQYAQWMAEAQWQAARAQAHARGISLFGDLPFVAGMDSPEVWANAGEFRLDVSTGVPPDAFSATGQDWGLPTYRWDVIAAGGYAWHRQRARRMAALFDGLRVDHVIGLFRTYGRPLAGDPFFTPADEPDQIAQGRALMRILAESGLVLIAEDLGVTPDFVRESLAALAIPGCRVMRWERDWNAPGAPFLPPDAYPERSATMTGTHDTEPVVTWWQTTSDEERAAFMRIVDGTGGAGDEPAGPPAWSNALRDRFLRAAYRSGSSELFLPFQDLFGWPDRINVPGTVGPHNWTWCLPWPVERLGDLPEARERAAFFRRLAEETGRAALAYTNSSIANPGRSTNEQPELPDP
jgi:4-alpha-glucanotransferase